MHGFIILSDALYDNTAIQDFIKYFLFEQNRLSRLQIRTTFAGAAFHLPLSVTMRGLFHSQASFGPGHAKMSLMPYANSKGACASTQSDQPLVVRCLDRIIPLVSITEISSLQLASEAEQARLNLNWSQIPDDMFLHDMARFFCNFKP